MAENWDESSESSRDERSPAPSVTARPGRREVLSSVGLVVSVPITGCLAGAPAERSDTETESAIDSRSASNSGGDDTSEHSGGSQSRSAALSEMATERTVEIVREDDVRFDPQLVWLKPGGRVTWINRDDRGRHDVVPIGRRTPVGATNWRSAALEEGERFERAFDREGVYDYLCTRHEEFLFGRLVVGRPDPADEPALTAPDEYPDRVRVALGDLNERTRSLLVAASDDCGCPG
ncbi:cupredoxin domain-containing protein [Natrialba swarupiae]|uniref:Blue (type 1) copper domain-containing protein n=1 Tax=Natrialba swarupiae TaxID=2448032 RepID=A0A5D5ASA9_9EURY|nr:plastocyanin/azurin family copper-binding protein [Natrialba swarupiae]TYT62712.1 hypothetical protein FYC77_06675 [Natrialba swarupiae]